MLVKRRLGIFFKLSSTIVDRFRRPLAVSTVLCYAVGLERSCRAFLTGSSVAPQSYSSQKSEARVSGVTNSLCALSDSVREEFTLRIDFLTHGQLYFLRNLPPSHVQVIGWKVWFAGITSNGSGVYSIHESSLGRPHSTTLFRYLVSILPINSTRGISTFSAV